MTFVNLRDNVVGVGKMIAALSLIIAVFSFFIYEVYGKEIVAQINQNKKNSIKAKDNSQRNYYYIKELLTGEQKDRAEREYQRNKFYN